MKSTIILLVSVFLLLSGNLYAMEQSSANYTIESNVVSGGGVESESKNYFIGHTLGQSSAIGESSSSNYVNYGGFWYTPPLNLIVHLSEGLNIINYPGEPRTALRAFELISLLGDSSEIESIKKYDSQAGKYKVVTYSASGVPSGDDFEIINGEAYLVSSKSKKSASVNAKRGCSVFDLTVGLNLAGISCVPKGMRAFHLLDTIGDEAVASSIQRFNRTTGQMESAGYLNLGIVGTDFPIKSSEGYFIYMKQ